MDRLEQEEDWPDALYSLLRRHNVTNSPMFPMPGINA
jgi:hypothetical protein